MLRCSSLALLHRPSQGPAAECTSGGTGLRCCPLDGAEGIVSVVSAKRKDLQTRRSLMWFTANVTASPKSAERYNAKHRQVIKLACDSRSHTGDHVSTIHEHWAAATIGPGPTTPTNIPSGPHTNISAVQNFVLLRYSHTSSLLPKKM